MLRNYFGRFSVRKIVLAIADMFIIAMSVLIAVFVLTLFRHQVSVRDAEVTIAISVFTCCACLSVSGAYRRMWRYFNIKD